MLDSLRHMSADGFRVDLIPPIEVYGHLAPIIIRHQMSFGIITTPHLHSHPLLLLKPMLSMGILEGEEELHHLSWNRLHLGALAKKGKSVYFQITCTGLAILYRWM